MRRQRNSFAAPLHNARAHFSNLHRKSNGIRMFYRNDVRSVAAMTGTLLAVTFVTYISVGLPRALGYLN